MVEVWKYVHHSCVSATRRNRDSFRHRDTSDNASSSRAAISDPDPRVRFEGFVTSESFVAGDFLAAVAEVVCSLEPESESEPESDSELLLSLSESLSDPVSSEGSPESRSWAGACRLLKVCVEELGVE